MANANLATDIQPSTPGHTNNHIVLHGEVNELSRNTGPRNITASLVNGWKVNAGGFVVVERIRDMVHLYTLRLNGVDATEDGFVRAGVGSGGPLENGFVPVQSYQSPLEADAADGLWRLRMAYPHIQAFGGRGKDLGGFVRHFMWRTTNPWPTTLPGTAGFPA